MTQLSINAKLSAQRNFSAWTETYGDEEVVAVLGDERWAALRAVEVSQHPPLLPYHPSRHQP